MGGKGGFPLPQNTGDLPIVAAHRVNLTALSQTMNLYFAAIMEEIHVTRPRDLLQKLPGVPDWKLVPPTSPGARAGVINPTRPHCPNHIMVGMLGDFEVLLIACDDGDLIGYLTRDIAHAIDNMGVVDAEGSGARPARSSSCPRPFLHTNVGSSAWGLAIHQHAQLIAVSSNLVEITIFAAAVTSGENIRPPQRFVSKPPHAVANMPSVSFRGCDVVAVDLAGNLWTFRMSGGTECIDFDHNRPTATDAYMEGDAYVDSR